ncbi:MAG: hypothetical protein ACE361_26225 [Aureliella sp.]
MDADPLLTTLLDLDLALPNIELSIGGGYGLFLKQQHLAKSEQIRTLLPLSAMPFARTTEDIDWILRADIVTDSSQMGMIRRALDTLGFRVVETAKYTQFVRKLAIGSVKIDLLAAPLREFAQRVPRDTRRVKPRPSVKLHASKLEEALAVEQGALRVTISGKLSSGDEHSALIQIPQTFSYLLMKLIAFDDRRSDEDKDFGRHHALDIYRIVAMLTKDEDSSVRRLFSEYSSHEVTQRARQIAMTDFVDRDGIGLLRIQEHQLYSQNMELKRFVQELKALFDGSA